MFLFTSLLAVAVVYWFSAFLAEVALGASEELQLHPVVRVGFGFFISLVYFSAAWQLMPIQEAWVLGGVILFLYGYGKFGFSFFTNSTVLLKKFVLKYGKLFLVFILGAVIFFAPNIVSKNFGPFTEGGGDITIYADTAKLLTDHQMTSLGQVQPNFNDQMKTIRSLLDFSSPSKYEKFAEIQNEFYKLYGSKLNPPIADVSAYRVVQDTFFSSVFYAPYAQFYFLSGVTNYNVYFGTLAFLYICLLGGVWSFFAPFGKKISILAVAVVAASHGLISVYYNHYSMQGISLTITALILAAVPNVRLFSWAGLRVYGSVWIIIAVLYVHFLAIVTPIMLLALFSKAKQGITLDTPVPIPERLMLRPMRAAVRFSAVAVFMLLSGLYLVSGGAKSIEFLQGLLADFLSRSTNAFLGEHISYLSLQWTSFLFGFLSQQHYQPFASEISFVQTAVGVGVVLGAIAIILGALLMAKGILLGAQFVSESRVYLVVWCVAILTVAAHLYLARTSLYTQAKGAQNVMVYFYVAMLLPLAMGERWLNSKGLKKLTATLWVILLLFTATLLVPRVAYALKLAYGLDRSSILETSYFSEAERIHELDKSAFVLFEPRKSGDTYLSIQPFSGERMVPMRYLSLELMTNHGLGKWSKKSILASELIESSDIPHLWLLRAERVGNNEQWPSLNVIDYIWTADRLVDRKTPDIILFGDNYERNFGERAIDLTGIAKGKFSYLRNGAAMLYLPKGSEGNLEVTLESRDEKDYAVMVKEVGDRLTKGEMGSNVAMATDGKFITLTSKIQAEDKPTLKTIAHYSSEFWLNVRLNSEGL